MLIVILLLSEGKINMDYIIGVRIIYNLYGYYGGKMAGSVFDTNGLSPSLTTMQGGGRQPMIVEKYESSDK
jgi:hypothetical protein